MLQSQIISKQLPRRFLKVSNERRRGKGSFLSSRLYGIIEDCAATVGPHRYSTTAAIHRPQAAAAAAVAYAPRNTNNHRDLDLERYLQDSMSQFLPRAVRTSSQLDLELGEETEEHSGALAFAGSWEEHLWKLEEDDSLIDEEEFFVAVPEVTEPTVHTQQPQQQSTLKKQKSVMELLACFDPQNPPKLSEFDSREAALEAIQLWLECEAQQEAVFRYQKVIDDARTRHDYSSLSMVQRQIVSWFGPLQEAIEKKQMEFLTKQGPSVPSGKKFGPFICSLPSAKLAVIVAHETVMHSVLNTGGKGEGQNRRNHTVVGMNLASIASRIGQAVEDELVVHRMLHKRAQDAVQDMKARTESSGFEGNVSSISSSNEEPSLNDDADTTPFSLDEVDGVDTSVSNNAHKWTYTSSHLKNYLDEISQYQPSAKKRRVTAYAIRRARQVLEKDEEWLKNEKVQLGAALLQTLLETATIVVDGRDEMAFTLEQRWITMDKTQSFVAMNDRLYKMIASDKLESLAATTTRHKPMIVPPKPWTAAKDGGYRMLKVDLMRYHGCHTQREALQNADSSTIFDGLNALGRVKWKINKRLLEVAQKCWEDNIPLGDIPSRTDLDVPDEPEPPVRSEKKLEKGTEVYNLSVAEYRTYRDRLAKHNRVKQKNMDLRSLRCSVLLKLDQAEKFKDFDEIYFPYNMDFRGRAYPVPPHLSNVGSDLCRGMLQFAEEKPLGERGLYWLKVHLANFAGKDKMTFDARAKFVDEHMDQVRASATDPFGGERWWMTLEDPFQGLATCFEVMNAIDSGDPASYMCSLPVHMDGSCNGLQHYAALGRDSIGGKAVNLCATEEPQDVYVGVMHEVIRRVAQEADREVDFDISNIEALSRKQKKEFFNNRAAKLVNGLIDRGVVKRTVMTSVYGVTYIGARQQIQEKIESKLEGQGYDLDEINREIFQACGYLALVTMEVIGDLFSGAKGTMNWLTTCARMISQHGYPVAWISPIGLPAIQPYRQKKVATLVTLLQTVSLAATSDDLPIHKSKQVTAFPPNYIHSLDSSHMLLTALEMDRRGLTFSAVHDSFWTHPCDIDEMNGALRDVFVDLYSQPLLERLKETWEMRYPGLEFPDLPKRGDLDLNEVKKAKYFFQ